MDAEAQGQGGSSLHKAWPPSSFGDVLECSALEHGAGSMSCSRGGAPPDPGHTPHSAGRVCAGQSALDVSFVSPTPSQPEERRTLCSHLSIFECVGANGIGISPHLSVHFPWAVQEVCSGIRSCLFHTFGGDFHYLGSLGLTWLQTFPAAGGCPTC